MNGSLFVRVTNPVCGKGRTAGQIWFSASGDALVNGAPNAARAEGDGMKRARTRRTMKTLLTAAIFRGGDGKVEVCAARGGECAGRITLYVSNKRYSAKRRACFCQRRVATHADSAAVGARNLSRIFFPSDFVASGASMTPNQTVDRPDRANTTNTVSTNVSVSLSTNPRAAF